MFALGKLTLWPIRQLRDAVELRRLRKRLRNPHRWMISHPDGLRLENDAEYLQRLRGLAPVWAEFERPADRSSERSQGTVRE